MSSSIGITIFWFNIVDVNGGNIVEGLGGVDLGRVNDGKIVKGRGKDEDGYPLFLFWFWDRHC